MPIVKKAMVSKNKAVFQAMNASPERIYIYISRNVGGQGIRVPTGAASGDLGVVFLILAAFL